MKLLAPMLLIATISTIAMCQRTQAAEHFYQGKVVRLILGSGEASGVDTLGRITARRIEYSPVIARDLIQAAGREAFERSRGQRHRARALQGRLSGPSLSL